MAEHIELTCDQCGREDEAPVVGWVSIRPAKKSQVVAIPPARGDFCGIECLQTYIGRMVVQKELRATVASASFDLDAPLACPVCGTVIGDVYRDAFLATSEEPDERRCFECLHPSEDWGPCSAEMGLGPCGKRESDAIHEDSGNAGHHQYQPPKPTDESGAA